MLLPFPAANRDPGLFERADEVVIDRVENRHAAFGLGIHRCLGSNLARLEVRVAIEEFLGRFPDFELAGDVRWSVGQIRGPRAAAGAHSLSRHAARQAHREAGAPPADVGGGQRAAVGLDELAGDRQPEPGAAGVGGARGSARRPARVGWPRPGPVSVTSMSTTRSSAARHVDA